jgi:hypothetical protein
VAYKGIDKIIEKLASEISFSWLEKAYGLVDRIVEMRDEKPYIFPGVYEDDATDPISMMPSDLKSFCFFLKGAEAKFDEFEYGQLPLVRWPVSCIFYMDISHAGGYYKETRSNITDDIFNFFNTIHAGAIITPLKFIEDDITKVYEGFTLTDLDNKWKIVPKWCCRMDIEIAYRYLCHA